MLADPEMTIKEVAGVNRATIYRSLGLGSYAKGASSRRDETRGRAETRFVCLPNWPVFSANACSNACESKRNGIRASFLLSEAIFMKDSG